ncbi:Rdx family-domain-containing protein [Corynascus novoguineensis]|uniref:Rdx family-domain-containing protein n=1 Tax=Corynascus novoguineensis TaxID=1126955 RepID=A0AAN7CU61_9PEZI|nr:Rdx family-domain-containing protein [Corynascus novoguineensis]
MPQYTSRDVGDPSQIKKTKQSMADLKLRRLTELNSRLREDLERERIPVSQASKSIIAYCNSTRDYMYAQELLSTFSLSLGEVALQPATGGVFTVEITTTRTADQGDKAKTAVVILWDRKTDGGFPETKELKRRVRDVIEPGRDLGHVDRDHQKREKGKQGGSGGDGGSGSGSGDKEGEETKGQGPGLGGEAKDGSEAKEEVAGEKGNREKSCALGDKGKCEDCE